MMETTIPHKEAPMEDARALPTPSGHSGILASLRERLLMLGRDQGGAVGMLCLAATLMVFLVGLIIYDTGQVTRDKLDAQMAADTAAFSQAAVKARSMNMATFANIGKRTTVGIRNMYYFQYPMFASWYSGQCSRCCCGFWCGCWTACMNCIGNALVIALEGIDYIFFVIGRFTGDKITKNLQALDDFQKDIRDYTAYWGQAEAILRGGTNKGNFIGTFPKPGSSGNLDREPKRGSLPYQRATGFFAPMESCLTPTAVFNVSTAGTMLEWDRNFQVLKRQSLSRPFIARQGPREKVNRMYSAMGCAAGFLGKDATPSSPIFLSAPSESGEDHMARSNFVWSYVSDPALSRELRENYNYMTRDYNDSQLFTPKGGVWTMARGEVYFPPSAAPFNFGGFAHDHGIWMFHPGWTGKLRPFSLPGERSPVQPSDMWEEAKTGMLQQGIIFGSDASAIIQDQLYMRKVMKGLDGTIDNRDVIDGLAK
jgi:hypothetical protein